MVRSIILTVSNKEFSRGAADWFIPFQCDCLRVENLDPAESVIISFGPHRGDDLTALPGKKYEQRTRVAQVFARSPSGKPVRFQLVADKIK